DGSGLPGEETIELPGHRRAHAMPDKDRVLYARILEYCIHGAGEEVHAVLDFRLVALPVPGQVNQDKACLARVGGDLPTPEGQVTRPAVEEDQCRRAFAEALVMDPMSVQPGHARRGPVDGVGNLVSEQRSCGDGKDEDGD